MSDQPRQYGCSEHLWRMHQCVSIAYQLNSYYRTGELDYCRESTATFFKCMKIRISKREEAEKLIEEIERSKLPRGDHIFKFRELPRQGFSFPNTPVYDESAKPDQIPPQQRWPPQEWANEARDDVRITTLSQEEVDDGVADLPEHLQAPAAPSDE